MCKDTTFMQKQRKFWQKMKKRAKKFGGLEENT